MEASAVPLRGPLSWDDFAWLDEPAPVPPDTVKEPPADPLLGAICKGELISDRLYGGAQMRGLEGSTCAQGRALPHLCPLAPRP